jgi:hypothetical protein
MPSERAAAPWVWRGRPSRWRSSRPRRAGKQERPAQLLHYLEGYTREEREVGTNNLIYIVVVVILVVVALLLLQRLV